MEVLRSFVKALQAVERRQKGEVVDTPHQFEPLATVATTGGGTLSAAFAGWKKEAERPETTVAETERAVRLFTELHGDMAIATIKRSHVHSFRAALQNVPRQRVGKLADLKLPELAEWGREHPAVVKVSATTVNKQLGAVQSVALWARDKGGMVPDDVSWADPFSRMRLRADEPTRESFTPDELKAVFGGPVFTEGARPKGVLLSHFAILWNAEATVSVIPPRPSDVFLSILPLARAFERTLGYCLPMMGRSTVGDTGRGSAARALYLFERNRDTLCRIRGTNQPKYIGRAISSGCIHMTQ